MSTTGLVITRKPNESLEALINRFRHAVDAEGILKDYKLNVLFSREERDKFKKFSTKRRSDKKNKRITDAMHRTVDTSKQKKSDGVV